MSDLNIEPLLEWAKTNGAAINEFIVFKEVPGRGIGAFVNGKIDPSKPNISIPIKLTLNPQQAKEFFQTSFDGAEDINSITKHFLNYQRFLGEDSFWYQYIKLLPEGRDIGSPLYWTAPEKKYLNGTNLGASLAEFFSSFVEEWFDSVKLIPANLRDADYEENLNFYQSFKEGALNEDALFETITKYDSLKWTSFPCYLWATMIFKSRSFPFLLVDEDADPKYSMLLPVVDLLNHDPNSYVSWMLDESKQNFLLNNNLSSILNIGDELFNNYGGKGNEELLLGYGFVIEENKNDSVALRIKLPLDVLPQVEKFGINLPRLEDYTTSKFNLKPSKRSTDYKEFEKGVLFYCNEQDLLPRNLVNLFGYLVKNEIELMMSLRMRLGGLTQLRNALEQKLSVIKAAAKITDSNTALNKALVYKRNQTKLFTKMLVELKDQEKRILKDQKSKLWDLKKILKKDDLFGKSLLLTFGMVDAPAIEELGLQDQFFLLWLIRCANRKDQDFLPEWIAKLFHEISLKVKVSADDKAAYAELHNFLFPALSERIPEVYAHGDWGVSQFVISGMLLQLISYTRGSKDSIILVEPVAISL